MSKKNKQNIEKYVEKRLSKLIKHVNDQDLYNESRVMVLSGRHGFAVINVKDNPADGHDFTDYVYKLVDMKLHRALDNSISTKMDAPMDILKVQMYDGYSLKESSKRSIVKHVTPDSPDYAKMQGIDLDEAAERQMDNYVDTGSARKARIMMRLKEPKDTRLYIPDAKDKQMFALKDELTKESEKNKDLLQQLEGYKRDMEGMEKISAKQKSDLEAKETELKQAYDKAAEDYASIQKLTKEVGDLKIQIGKQNEEINKLKHPEPLTATDIVPTKVDTSTLSTVVSDMNEKITKLTDKVTTMESKPNYYYPVEVLKPKDNREIELEDEYMFRRLDEVKKPYSLRTIFKIAEEEMYVHISDEVYELLGCIRNPLTTMTRKYPRQAYALAISLAAPESYVGAFRDRLIQDYRSGDFVPTRLSCIPDDFEELLESIYPDVLRIQQIMHQNISKLPYVYKEDIGSGAYDFYMIGSTPYASPRQIKTETYVAIPRNEDPYGYISYYTSAKFKKNLVHIMRTDDPNALDDQLDALIKAVNDGILTLDTTDPDGIRKTQLWYYPIYKAYSEKIENESEK